MKTKRLLAALALAAALGGLAAPARAQTVCKNEPGARPLSFTLALHQRFVTTYKNRALLTTNFNVYRYPERPHSIKSSGDDGDIHIAGRDDVVRLPFVAEIMNPRYFKTLEGDDNLDFMKILRETSREQPVEVTGVWRLWFEHPGEAGEAQVMGLPVPIPADTSPPHYFELHPVTSFGGKDTMASFIEIKDYKKDADGEPKVYEAHPGSKTVPYYECLDYSVVARPMDDGRAGIVMASKKAQYNYTDLVIELVGRPKEYEDCFIALAHVYNSFEQEERFTNKPRRMIFVKGSPPALPESRIRGYRQGTLLRVLGIPRINLDEVAAVARASRGTLQYDRLPYEIIVAAEFVTEE